MTAPLAKVNEVIESGRWVPPNVLAVVDRNAEVWQRSSDVDFLRPHRSGRVTVSDLSRQEGPLRVVEVEPQPADRKLIGPSRAHLDAPCTDACYEPGGAREPRTWPKLPSAPDDLPDTVDVNRWRWFRATEMNGSGALYYQPGQPFQRTFNQLREMGEVREVLSPVANPDGDECGGAR